MNVASRDLRNDTAGLIRRVQAGEDVVITVRGAPVAKLVPIGRGRTKQWLTREELAQRLSRIQADPGLRADLERLAGDTTDDLPIE